MLPQNGPVPDSPATASESNVQCSPSSIDLISANMKLMVQKIQDLRHLGIEDNGLPLPKICVVGDQSTGKSSLIEGMSEIKVPRSAGCCTRCPLEINLSESDSPWSCRVLLMKKYIYDRSGRMGKVGRAPTRSKPFGPWIEQDPEEELFATLTDKEEVQEALKWAQLATLNPGRSHKEFMPGENFDTNDTYTQVKFSPNVVRLDISAPRFPNLSFYDLPGVINVAEVDEERYLVTLVENLVRDYIKARNCIVLLTLPMTDDATNSSAARIIRDVPGARERTLGVLTKPDRIQYGEGYQQWIEILRGEKFAVGHDYYVVRNNPNPRVEHAQARDEEAQFFSCAPWVSELSEYSARFGTRKLQKALSQLLLEQIQACLPGIIEQIGKRARAVEDELKTLPLPPSANVPYILCQKLNMFNDGLRCHIDGGSPEYPLQKVWSQVASDFQKSLLASRPTMRLLTEAEANLRTDSQPSLNSDDTDCEVLHARPLNKRKGAEAHGDVHSKRKKSKPSPVQTPVSFTTAHFSCYQEPAKVFTLEEIREINDDTYVSGIPGLMNPQTIESMNRLSVSHWKGPMEKFLAITYDMVLRVLMEQLDHVFLQYQQTALYGTLKVIVLSFMDCIRQQHFKLAYENYEIECAKPFTMATTALQRAQKEAQEYFSTRRRDLRGKHLPDNPEAHTIPNGTKKDSNRNRESEIGVDEYAREVEVMATVRGYYEIASSRFVDATCQNVHTKLFARCRNELHSVIESELGILEENASERCIELMVEDQERQIRRAYLKKEKDKLDRAQEWLKIAGDPNVAD